MSRPIRSAFVLALSVALVAPAFVRGEDEAPIADQLAKIMDRYNDDAGDRLTTAINLCEKRLIAKPDEVKTRLELARLKLAKGDAAGCLAEAEKALAAKAATKDDKNDAKVLAFAGTITGAEEKIRAAKVDERKQVQAEFKPKIEALQKELTEDFGSQAAAQGAVRKEQMRMNSTKEVAKLGKPPLAIDKPDLEGKEIKLVEYKGKVVLIDFWATWCGPCVAELPNVQKVYEAEHGNGFEIIGISLDQKKEKLDEFLAANKMPWRHQFDGKGWKNEVAVAWGIQSIPATYLIDHEGKVRFVGVRGPALATAVKELLARAKKSS